VGGCPRVFCFIYKVIPTHGWSFHFFGGPTVGDPTVASGDPFSKPMDKGKFALCF
jgi:hypothetical protein